METERLEGSVAGTVFRNEENGYSVIMVKAGRKAITCTGILPELAIGEQVVLTGTYVDHPQYGSQLPLKLSSPPHSAASNAFWPPASSRA